MQPRPALPALAGWEAMQSAQARGKGQSEGSPPWKAGKGGGTPGSGQASGLLGKGMNSKPGGKPTPAPWSDKAAKAGRPGKEKPVESRFKAHHDRMEAMRVVMVQAEEELVRLGGLADKARDAADEADAAYDAQDSLVNARRVALEVEEGVMASIKLELAGQQVRDLSARAALGICQKLVFSLEGAELPEHARPLLLEVGSAIVALLGGHQGGVAVGGEAGGRKRFLSEPGSEGEDPGLTPNPWGVKAESVNSDDMAGCEVPEGWQDPLSQFDEMDTFADEGCPEDACSDISGAILGPQEQQGGGPVDGQEMEVASDGSEVEWEPEKRGVGAWARAMLDIKYGLGKSAPPADEEVSLVEGADPAAPGPDQGGEGWEQAGRRGPKGRRVSTDQLSAPPVFAGPAVPAPKTPPVKAGRSPGVGDPGGRSRSPTGDPASGGTRSTATGGSPADGTPSAIRRAGRPRKEVETQSTTLDRWAVRRAPAE